MNTEDPVEKRIKLADWMAQKVITYGAGLTIASVAVMMLFIFLEVAPLLWKPDISPASEWVMGAKISTSKGLVAGADEYREIAYRFTVDGAAEFISLIDGKPLGRVQAEDLEGERITAAFKTPKANIILFGTEEGLVGCMEIGFRAVYSQTGRKVKFDAGTKGVWRMFEDEGAVRLVTGTVNEDGKVLIAAVSSEGALAHFTFDEDMEETDIVRIDDPPSDMTSLAMKSSGEEFMAGTGEGEVYVYSYDEGDVENVESFRISQEGVLAAMYLSGGESLVAGGETGEISIWLPVRHVFVKNNGMNPAPLGKAGIIQPGEERRVVDKDYEGSLDTDPALSFSSAGIHYIKARKFESAGGPVTALAPSPRNKGFLSLMESGDISYHFSTSGKTYETAALGRKVASIAFTPKSDGFLALDDEDILHSYSLDEKHPGITLKTLFGRVWYEGYQEPDLVWQSTGGADDFEPKLSLWPLIFGTFKGTLYAMLFSIPISVLGAIYISQLAPSGLRGVVKPAVEIMAAIPSVVIGFFAGLWLSPVLDKNLMAFFMILAAVPAGWLLMVSVFWALPYDRRPDISGRWELLRLLPVMGLSCLVAALAAPVVEGLVFGGDVKGWIFSALGLLYDPRNCIVVGFALGFAVIPIIFTISEDALSAVPPSLTAAAYALAASKWQTAIHVVLPAASPGIFAAVMLGLGRAVGETMIVLMATGNTPIMDLSVFNGFRAMSAAIAVEMPEAPHGGSLYRVLFLTGLLLFAFTFVINTLATVVSNRLRRKYSRF